MPRSLSERWREYRQEFRTGWAIGIARGLTKYEYRLLPKNIGDSFTLRMLGDASKQIRLLQIRPAEKFEDQLVCDHYVVDIPSKIEYVALSYACGEPVFDRAIILNGRQFLTTENLELALKRVRDLDFSFVWVDQICINQEDPDERASQVLIMSKIYLNAHRVVIYLGEEGPDTKVFLQWLNHFRHTVLGKLSDASFPPLAADQILLEQTSRKHDLLDTYLSFPEAATRGADDLILRPWFSRSWVIQEVSLLSRRLCLCGDAWFLFNIFDVFTGSFRDAMIARAGEGNGDIKFYLTVPARAARPTLIYQNVEDYNRWGAQPLFHILENTCNFDVTEPRDKFYSLLGLASDADQVPIPNYTKPVADVYAEYARYFLQQGNKASLLWHADLASKRPSWVPVWKGDNEPYHILKERFDVALVETGLDLPEDGVQIVIEVAFIDVVGKVADKFAPSEFHVNTDPLQTAVETDEIQRIKKWLRSSLATLKLASTPGCDDIEELHAVLAKLILQQPLAVPIEVFVGIEGRLLIELMKCLDDDAAKIIKDVITSFCNSATELIGISNMMGNLFVSTVRLQFPKRKIVVTENGKYGWGPNDTSEGDRIVHIRGAYFLSILRPEPDGYFLVGHVRLPAAENTSTIVAKDLEYERVIIV